MVRNQLVSHRHTATAWSVLTSVTLAAILKSMCLEHVAHFVCLRRWHLKARRSHAILDFLPLHGAHLAFNRLLAFPVQGTASHGVASILREPGLNVMGLRRLQREGNPRA